MQALLPYLLGEEHPAGVRLVDSQPCIRAQDIEEVGDNRHTTFFEMLGNWSLGDYFKEAQIRAFFAFLTKEVGLDPRRLYVTCFAGDERYGLPRDEESASIWYRVFQEAGVPASVVHVGSQANGDRVGVRGDERIFYYDSDENWWSRGGSLEGTPLGDPCGPDSEVFYDFGPEYHDPSFGLAHPASDSGQFMEIGNQVFMQYRREQDGSFTQLERPNVDFGGGLERITAASLGTPDVYQGSLLWPIVQLLECLSSTSYEVAQTQLRIITDHLRGAVFLAGDGVVPSNKEQGYVMRRLLRRAISTAHGIGLTEDFFEPVVNEIVDIYSDAYPQLHMKRAEIVTVFVKEEQTFRRTLAKGLQALRRYEGRVLTGEDIFVLSDTHGFPKELSVELAREYGIEVYPRWQAGFDLLLEAQRARSRGNSKLKA
jgi:alanyl-tRNA synthetase